MRITTYELDKSFLASTVPQIGGALFIGQTLKGPAFVPININNYNQYYDIFGGTHEQYYLPYCARNFLKNSGPATIIRVLGSDGYTADANIPIVIQSGSTKLLFATLQATKKYRDDGITILNTVLLSGSSVHDFNLTYIYTVGATTTTSSISHLSLNYAHSNFIANTFGYEPQSTSEHFYIRYIYNYMQSIDATWDIASGYDPVEDTDLIEQYYVVHDQTSSLSASAEFQDYTYGYSHPESPWIVSQDMGSGSQHKYYNLFKIHAISDGENANSEFKIEIADIKYTDNSFTLLIRDYDDTDALKNVLEEYRNVNMDPTSKQFVGKVVGDKYAQYASDGKINYYGNYDNKSKYIRLEIADMVLQNQLPTASVPFGHAGLPYIKCPMLLSGSGGTSYTSISEPVFSYRAQQTYDAYTGGMSGENSNKVCFGIKWTDDLKFYLQKRPALNDSDLVTTNSAFHLEDCFYTASDGTTGSVVHNATVPYKNKKFNLPLYGGFDGYDITKPANVFSGSSARFPMEVAASTGTVDFRKAIDIINNTDIIVNHLLFIPEALYTSVTSYALSIIEDENRQDMFFIPEMNLMDDTVTTAISNADLWDTNYAGTYYPWVRMYDFDNEKDVWLPPSCGVAEAFSFTDKNAYPWYPASGRNRGVLGGVTSLRNILLPEERNDLRDNRVNPIAVFNGVATVWGNKTLQQKVSKLSSINVRRMLIYSKSLIKQTVTYLIDEPINNAFIDRFLNLINPILTKVKENGGVDDFKIVLDSSVNTAETLDRNEFNALIYLKPTPIAEEIKIGFIVTTSGVVFSES